MPSTAGATAATASSCPNSGSTSSPCPCPSAGQIQGQSHTHSHGHGGLGHGHGHYFRSNHNHTHSHNLQQHQHQHQHTSSAPSHASVAAYNSALNKPVVTVSVAPLSDSNSVSSVSSSSTSTTASTPTSYCSPTTTATNTPVSSPASSTTSPTPRSTPTFATPASSTRSGSKRTVHFRSGTSISANTNNNSAPCIPILSVVPPPGQDGGDGEARRPTMQRVSAFLPSWDKRSSNSRAGLFGWSSNRSSTSISVANSNSLSRINTSAANASGRVQREAFWPATLDLECEKAARILKSFSSMLVSPSHKPHFTNMPSQPMDIWFH